VKVFQELAKAREEYQAKIGAAGESAVQEAAQTVFEAHPEIQRIQWTQYTPYFNDGEPCVFNVHDVEFYGAGETSKLVDEDDDNYGDEIQVAEGWGDDRKVLLKVASEFSKLVDDNQDLMEILGEGKVVIERGKKLRVEDYDHD
jgi:hypothetical protein